MDEGDEETAEVDGQEDIAAALYRESPLHAWLEYVRGKFPGAASETSDSGEEPQKPVSPPSPRGRRPRRRWTPSERVGRRFVNLVKRYIHSLTDVEYMQTLSVPYTLAYYVVFQRITWLLLQHDVIDVDNFVRLVTSINGGFFGAPDEQPPALCPWLNRHMQRVWRDNWQMTEVPTYALASVILSEHPPFEPQVSEPKDDGLTAQMHEIDKQNLRALCGIMNVMGISWVSEAMERLAHQVHELYGWDGDSFAFELMDYIEHCLESIETILDDWIRKVAIALGDTDDTHLKQHLYRAMVDYGRAQYDILGWLQDIEAQATLCSDLIFWMECAGDSDAVNEWSEVLVNLLQGQGKGYEAAEAMFRQGKALFFGRKYEAAANILRQASLLAERLDDSLLRNSCEQFLRNTEFFVRAAKWSKSG